ncbi:MAG: GNAT family N-acetyltransferase [Gemmatimonadetes bacterium]|jgi:GNAT superfamily N-acetyltransferase|nr:GNAT family N-acetyltransferase [Gemmatimonadota bacterium]MBT6144629.1 GNAT family N-acetyltransferase [Gemmatimonadota bacterium]MBT7863923.1 GNAT family N-acetyltransferase [Gemmatimonadota bacterium]
MSKYHQWKRDADVVSTDPERLNLDVIHGFLTTSYWCPGIERDTVATATRHSLCFGVYRVGEGGEVQIGFARIVTDYARFAYLLDVFILEPYRGQGLGRWLIACILECPELQKLPSIGLATRDAHSLYEPFGWERVQSADHLMRLSREL